MAGIEEIADELYGLPPEEFTAARTRYEKEAKAAGARDEAAHIHSLAKPTVTAWLANQLARTHRDELEPLLEVGAGLRDATRNLDGDQLRSGLSSDLGLSRDDRAEQARRAAHVARLISRSGIVAIVALVSPYAEDRKRARETHDGLEFLEVWVDTPLSVCEQRDPKGLFRRARSGELSGLTGIDSPYELPTAPDVTVRGYGVQPAVAAAEVIAAFDAQRARSRS